MPSNELYIYSLTMVSNKRQKIPSTANLLGWACLLEDFLRRFFYVVYYLAGNHGQKVAAQNRRGREEKESQSGR